MRGQKRVSEGKESEYLGTYIPEVTKRVSTCSPYGIPTIPTIPSLILHNYLTYRTVPKV